MSSVNRYYPKNKKAFIAEIAIVVDDPIIGTEHVFYVPLLWGTKRQVAIEIANAKADFFENNSIMVTEIHLRAWLGRWIWQTDKNF